ncbi:bacteriophage T5 orf172 domain-containing [Variovorax paradoxus B4]|uniref:Bacteriophage T5 orf172 domain-containing n=2 Tax=Variovorax paradoxus TaxID=34073 RepID=T1XHG2_VARPD|nr:bacteriophage T5 orf172 domain-containing [Variovorax paradoxus B4]
MASHQDRMAEIGFWTLPPKGSERRKGLDAFIEENKDNPKHQKLLKEIFEGATALVIVQNENGAGLSADRQLREYNAEYNNRVFHGSLRDMPSSFNVVEAFNKFLPKSGTFELRDECDHLFSFQHFIDWVTSGASDQFPLDIQRILPEGKAHSYNSIDKPSGLLFRSEGSEEFGFSSISLIRVEKEVTALLVAGQKCNLEDETKNIHKLWESTEALPHRAHIAPDEDLIARAEPLVEDPDLWKTVVLLRFDLETKTVDAQYVFHDCGTTYTGKTDDVSAFLDEKGEFFSEKIKKQFEQSASAMKDYGTLFELCKTCLLLPTFFEAHNDDIEIERHPTSFREYRSHLKNKKVFERVNPKHWITYRDVRLLRAPPTRSPDRTIFNAPEYKVEKSGYWRKLPIDVEGRDKVGRPIHGRTWVSQVQSWVEDSPTNSTVFASRGGGEIPGSNPGFIYVMRSAAHLKDVFKVGLTRRTSDERSGELSRSTSSPDHFLVVEEWATGDCVQAERLIHEELASYRFNPSREFFKAPYRTIFKVIDKVISSLEGDVEPCRPGGT